MKFSCVILWIWFNEFNLFQSQPCPNDCSARGRCINPGQTCNCFDGFFGGDCSLIQCPSGPAWFDSPIATDNAHNLAVCSNRGLCDPYSGTCSCLAGFEGSACQRLSCPGLCSGVGKCLSMRSNAMTYDPGYGPVYTYTNIWDAELMYGCKCDSGFSGPDCSLQKCPTGDDPMTGNGVSMSSNPTQVNTIQRVNCRGGAGTFTLSFEELTTGLIPFDASGSVITEYLEALPTIGPGGVVTTLYGLQACLASGQSYFQVQFLQNFGSLPLMVADYSQLGANGLITVSVFQAGTKENDSCSGRGLCDVTTGTCACASGFSTSDGYNAAGTRGDCGFYNVATPLTSCPGVTPCTGNGVCLGSPTFACECSTGWTGADCSERVCPFGPPWFSFPTATDTAHILQSTECSSMGICDRTTGICACMQNFEGAACELMACPGVLVDCSGQGQCVSMAVLATLTTVNGDFAEFTYGLTPNDATTWDANQIQGCLCDAGYMGYDCSQFSCPYGSDPSALGQRNEVQVLACTDQDLTGSVVLSFRQQQSTSISATATIKEIAAALESMSSVGAVNVKPIDGSSDSLCSTIGNQISVTFLQAHGDLPQLTYAINMLDVFSVSTIVTGTTESLECSNRGICDRLTGICSCFEGYSSSDGMGNAGTIGDCGYLLQFTTND